MTVDLNDIRVRIQVATQWVLSLYQSDGTYGYLKEHPGFPVGIAVKNNDGTVADYRLLGDWRRLYITSPWYPCGVIKSYSSWTYSDSMYVGMDDRWDGDYNEPELILWRDYGADYTKYSILFYAFEGSGNVDVWFNDIRIWPDVKFSPPQATAAQATDIGHIELTRATPGILGVKGKTARPAGAYPNPYSAYTSLGRSLPCNHYTVRHAARLGQWLCRIAQDAIKESFLRRLWIEYGFTWDIYDPLFGIYDDTFREWVVYPEDFVYTLEAYHDTPDVWATLPRGVNPMRFPYMSKVHLNLPLYIMNSTRDPLLRMLHALHIINRYKDPYYKYGAQVYGESVTPVDIGEEAIGLWTGYGIPHPRDGTVMSAVRTAAFISLMTTLGYRFNIDTYKKMADEAVEATTGMMAPQAGLYPLASGWVCTEKDGRAIGLVRANYHGAVYNLWGMTDMGIVGAADKDRSILDKLIDMYNMPPEDCGPIVSNIESTVTMLQAWRTYLIYKSDADRWLVPGV